MDEDRTREWIIDRTTDRIYSEGFSGFTMDDVAGDSGVSKKTLYQLIPSKNDLIMLVLGRQIDIVDRKQQEILADTTLDFPAKLDAVVRAASDLLGRFRRKAVRDMIKISPELWELIRNRRGKILDGMIRIIEEGRQQNMIRDDIKPSLLARYFHQVIDILVTPTTAMEEDMTPGELLDVTLSIIYRGVLTGGGSEKLHRRQGGRL